MGRTEALRAEALSHIADGRMDQLQSLAERVEAEEPRDPRNVLLLAYLREEAATEALLTTAQRLFALGNPREARAAAAEALNLDPWRTRARTLLCQLDRMLVET